MTIYEEIRKINIACMKGTSKSTVRLKSDLVRSTSYMETTQTNLFNKITNFFLKLITLTIKRVYSGKSRP